jgi:hypothetical protein
MRKILYFDVEGAVTIESYEDSRRKDLTSGN